MGTTPVRPPHPTSPPPAPPPPSHLGLVLMGLVLVENGECIEGMGAELEAAGLLHQRVVHGEHDGVQLVTDVVLQQGGTNCSQPPLYRCTTAPRVPWCTMVHALVPSPAAAAPCSRSACQAWGRCRGTWPSVSPKTSPWGGAAPCLPPGCTPGLGGGRSTLVCPPACTHTPCTRIDTPHPSVH